MSFQEEWPVPRRARECAVTGRPFRPGDRMVSELFDRGDTFERRDRLEGAAPPAGEPPAFSRWVAVWPPEPERAPGVDLDLARRFLRDLLAEGAVERRPLAYVLALLLVRKRRLRVLEHGLAPDGTALLRVAPPDDPEDVQEIPSPPMPAEVVAAVSAEVAALFGFGGAGPEEAGEGGDVDEGGAGGAAGGAGGGATDPGGE